VDGTHPEPMVADMPPAPADRVARRDWLRLIRSHRVGPVTFRRLMAEYGDAATALAALPAMAEAAGIKGYAPCSPEQAEAEIAAGHKAGARALFLGAADYPAALADLPDAPPILWALGDLSLAGKPMVALVGARNASSLGLRMARALTRGLNDAGFVVVSGLARGIDTAAHTAALECGGGTVAVMAGGVDVVYPAENAGLAQRVAEQGLRLSEQPPGLVLTVTE